MTWKHHFRIRRQFAVQFVVLVVAAHGVFILATSLLDQLAVRHGSRLTSADVDVPLAVGVSLLYLSTLLRRRKQTAWVVTILAYSFYLGVNVTHLVHQPSSGLLTIVRDLVLPLAVVGVLLNFRSEFMVRSDIKGFGWAARFAAIILTVALLYGVAGFSLLDESDFHEDIHLPAAIHYTVDQFDLTVSHPVHTYTRRAQLFVDSLSFISVVAVGYAAFSLFQPLRARLSDQSQAREAMFQLLKRYPAHSEDFFKLWPHDKQYLFDDGQRSGLAFHTNRGVALCLGDPAGQPTQFNKLLTNFQELCFYNDWLPALVHVQDTRRRLYEQKGYSLQKIGQEAIVDVAHFQAEVASSKYFRQIRNRFAKQGYSCEWLSPPHHPAVLERLNTISQEWLSRDGRVERGFVMGYFTNEYLQQCSVLVARDAAGTIQAFINQVPADFDDQEATFDMLRHTHLSLGNSNDYLLMNFIDQLQQQGYRRLNLGLCPLVGLDEADKDANVLIDAFLRFAYANGDRFYSFSGLHRFKAKYQPEWRDRYIAYQGGVRGFSRTMAALMRTMRVRQRAAFGR